MGTDAVCTIRERVADRIGESRFRTWFGEATAFDLTQRGLAITVPNTFISEWIVANYLDDLTAATRDVMGGGAIVDIKVDRAAKAAVASLATTGRTDGGDTPVSSPLPADPGAPKFPARSPAPQPAAHLRGRLETFVVGDCNQLAYAAAQQVVDSPSGAFRPLFLHGGCGLGKTHLMQGICNGVRLRHPTLRWCYISGEEFTNEFVYAVKSGRIDAFRARFRKVDLLVIDDIHFLANKRATQEEFLHTFNAIDGCGKTVVLSSDRHPKAIAELSEPLTNRLVAGMVVELALPDYATRRRILANRAQTMETTVPDAVLDVVAEKVSRNVRELEGALYKLVAVASLMKQPLTPDLVQTLLAEYITAQDGPPTPEDIEFAVAEFFDVSRERIHSKTRDRTVALARAVAMHFVRKLTTLSFPEIGRAMGNKNHSTVVMAVRRISETLKVDGSVRWKSTSGMHERNLRELLAEAEKRIEMRRRA